MLHKTFSITHKMSLKEIILLHVVNQPSFNKIFLLFYFAALETLFPPLLIMDSLQRLSFWQTNVRKKTTAGKEETIIEINQENGENKKETKTNIITTEMLHRLIINVSMVIYLQYLLLCVLYQLCIIYTHKYNYKCFTSWHT